MMISQLWCMFIKIKEKWQKNLVICWCLAVGLCQKSKNTPQSYYSSELIKQAGLFLINSVIMDHSFVRVLSSSFLYASSWWEIMKTLELLGEFISFRYRMNTFDATCSHILSIKTIVGTQNQRPRSGCEYVMIKCTTKHWNLTVESS